MIASREGVSGILLLFLYLTTDTLFTQQFLTLLYRSSYLVISIIKDSHRKAYPYYFKVSLIQNSKQTTLNNLFYFFNFFCVCLLWQQRTVFLSDLPPISINSCLLSNFVLYHHVFKKKLWPTCVVKVVYKITEGCCLLKIGNVSVTAVLENMIPHPASNFTYPWIIREWLSLMRISPINDKILIGSSHVQVFCR